MINTLLIQNCLPLQKSGESSAIPVRKGKSAGASNKVKGGGGKRQGEGKYCRNMTIDH